MGLLTRSTKGSLHRSAQVSAQADSHQRRDSSVRRLAIATQAVLGSPELTMAANCALLKHKVHREIAQSKDFDGFSIAVLSRGPVHHASLEDTATSAAWYGSMIELTWISLLRDRIRVDVYRTTVRGFCASPLCVASNL